MSRSIRPADLPLAPPLRAGSFIVTLFGDVIAPRGGDIWIGNIIAFCAPFGISETLIRTAMSRLVAAGQVTGLRQGRRSFYRLTDAARQEYAQAARIIYGPPRNHDWRLVFLPHGDASAQITSVPLPGHVALSDHFTLGPAQGLLPADACALSAPAEGNMQAVRTMAQKCWPLDDLAQGYDAVLALTRQIATLGRLPDAQALEARVLLVHAFRAVALRDPALPPEALPDDWAGERARRAFAEAYLGLSGAADSHVAENFEAADGPLPGLSAEGEDRIVQLRACLKA